MKMNTLMNFAPSATLLLGLGPSGEGVKVNGATVTTADIEASNGVIHVIDAVLLPPDKGATK